PLRGAAPSARRFPPFSWVGGGGGGVPACLGRSGARAGRGPALGGRFVLGWSGLVAVCFRFRFGSVAVCLFLLLFAVCCGILVVFLGALLSLARSGAFAVRSGGVLCPCALSVSRSLSRRAAARAWPCAGAPCPGVALGCGAAPAAAAGWAGVPSPSPGRSGRR